MNMVKLLVILLLLPFTAYAQEGSEKLTGLEIEGFFKDIEETYTQEKPDREKIIARIRAHTFDSYEITNNVKAVTSLNLDPEIMLVKQNLEEFIAEIINKEETLHNTTISHTITDIKYSDDKTTADVSYTSLFKGILKKFSDEHKRMMMVKFVSFAQCTERLGLENDVVKSYRANCDIETIYRKPEPAE